MNLHHLQYFYVVAQEQGFSRASEKLRISQPAISRMVKQLEDHFGFPLFERSGRKATPTAQGVDVFERCKSIFGEVDRLKSSLGDIKGVCKGPLIFGAAEPIASYFVPARLGEFLTAHE